MDYKLDAACGCFLGTDRTRNEDNFLFNGKHLPAKNHCLRHVLTTHAHTEDPVLLAVFDGMGGGKDGHDAACAAAEAFAKAQKKTRNLVLTGREFFESACLQANDQIVEMTRKRQYNTMGSTVAALRFSCGEVVSCNVGDSKIFRIRDGVMFQLSQDHTDERILAAMGIQKKPVLLQYLGIPTTQMLIEPYITRGEIALNDIYLLCSDGVTDCMDPTAILQAAVTATDPEAAVKQILSLVSENGGKDNATVIMIRITQ